MTLSQRICQIFAALVLAVILTGTVIDCAGFAGKVGGFIYENMRGD